MARIAGVDLPRNKRIEIGLQAIYGIGLTSSRVILKATGIDPGKKVKDLTEDEVTKIRKKIESDHRVEGSLRAETSANIKRLIDIGCYRGTRHKKGLPVRGQRTRTNTRPGKGPRKTAAVLKVKKEE